MSEGKTFTDAVVACLLYNAPAECIARCDKIKELVQRVLGEDGEILPKCPKRDRLQQELDKIRAALPAACDHIALIAGGATKIKGYVFEAPKLPEIRGASALLDWVNEVGLKTLWRDKVGKALNDADLAEKCIIYASGGGFLAFAPAELGEELAAAVEACYTEHTLTANSVAVSETFRLLELRYGRLAIEDTRIGYWLDEFLDHWKHPALRAQLASYYYGSDEESPADRFYNRKTFGELVTLLATMTNRRREERATHGDTRSMPFYQMLPWADTCQTSGVRPAVMMARLLPNTPALSEPSARKAYVGRKIKHSSISPKWFEEVFEWRSPKQDSWQEIFIEKVRGTPYYEAAQQQNVDAAQDVGEIAQASDPKGYIGLIYADGNNVGRRVAVAATPYDYYKLSHDLDHASRSAVFGALKEHLLPTPIRNEQGYREFIHPFEIIAIGGDDLLLIVPGNKALDIALAIGQNFERIFADSQKQDTDSKSLPSASDQSQGRYRAATTFVTKPYTPSIGLSAGVIVAQENAPIFFLRDLVEELLKSAKGLAKENAKHGFYGGAVDFMVMKSITMVTDRIKSFRRQALGDDGKKSKRRLTARPYTWHEFAGLLDTVRALKKARVPRSQLYRLRRALDADPGSAITPSVMEYLYTRVRMQTGHGQALLNHIEQPWCWSTPVPQRTGGLPPWMPLCAQGWETIWPDMLEAYEMVPEQIEEQP